jgi:two-component system, chemotaxis family, CheB/CheR fusion protein
MAEIKKRKMTGGPRGRIGRVARRAVRARKKAEALHAKADLAHSEGEQAHRQAKAAHNKVHTLEEEMRRKADSPAGKPLPPRTGARPPGKSEGRGSPTMAASYGATPESRLPFSVVGLGASAGGYEAYTDFLAHLPKETGMAFVLVQHLDPSHPSHLGQLLSKASALPVTEIKNCGDVRPDRVYVIPSNTTVVLRNGRFRLSPRLNPRGVSMPIDMFFRSLAMEQQNRAIGIVLSGTGTDGTLGLQEIKGQGGITFAQDQGTAKHFGMPASAIAAGAVDFVMTPEQMTRELMRFSGHPYVAPVKQRTDRAHPPALEEGAEVENLFRQSSPEVRTLFMLLRTRTNVDFSLYKPGTLARRIMRRMLLHKIDSIGDYVKSLQESPAEVDALFNDLLISVTGFFRDSASFHALQKKILPRLLRDRPGNAPLRIWSCGCSTGEEAYSLAIAVSEVLEKARKQVPVQIFASDLNERGIEKARAGVYHENILLDISGDRLKRFFTKVNGFYQINKSIRDLCVFARHNAVMDPPFSNLDLISCRNMLIYLAPVLQKRILPVFHHALKPRGFLLLGSSETIGESSHLFELSDRKNKIYSKKLTLYSRAVDIIQPPLRDVDRPVPRSGSRRQESRPAQLQEEIDRVILSRYSPDGVLIDEKMDVFQFRGQTGQFLQHQHGAASLNLLKMVREELALDVRRTVTEAIQTGKRVERRATQIYLRRGPAHDVIIQVDPVTTDGERFFLVLFREVLPAAEETRELHKNARASKKATDARMVSKLREELASTKESLQAIIEEQEATNEELKSANEEIQSSNEELHSTNEELETAREELQSTNEELTTLNEELQNRNTDLACLNNDLINLLNSVNIAVIILGRDLTIRRFTATAEKLFNLIASDLGRPLTDLTRNVRVPDLEQTIAEVIENLTVIEQEVEDTKGHWYALRIRPYRTQDNRVEGVVLMLLDIDELRRAMVQMMGIVRHPLLLLYGDLRVVRANDAFYRNFNVTFEEIENRLLYDLGNGQWDLPELRELLEQILPERLEVHDFLVEHEFPKIGKRRIMINARRFYDEHGVQRIAIAFEDITETVKSS